MSTILQAGKPAIILDSKLGGQFIAEAAVIEPSGWLRARGRVKRRQAGELPDLVGPTSERAWSPRMPVRVQWGEQ